MAQIIVVMYHYVRDPGATPYPGIKGLAVERFRGQLEYLTRHYPIIGMEEVIEASDGRRTLPDKSVLLTFDDGYVDHYETVFPILMEYRIQGSFFPPAEAVLQGKVLDVNKIHFILAVRPDHTSLLAEVVSTVDRLRQEYGIPPWENLPRPVTHPQPLYDSKETAVVKALLQFALPEEPRRKILDYLFRCYVTTDEVGFSQSLYMSMGQLRRMRREGMHIGAHGYSHRWMDSLTPEEQRMEMEQSVNFLEAVGADPQCLTLCYPYGAADEGLIELAGAMGFRMGFSSRSEVSDLRRHQHLLLPRLDTNEIPDAEAVGLLL